MILSQLIYLTTIFEPPKKYIREINKILRKLYFKNTLERPSMETSPKEETEGGTGLSHLEIKIKSLRMKCIYEATEEKYKYPLFEYYNGLRLFKYKRMDNTALYCFQQPKNIFKTSIITTIPNVARTNQGKGNTIYKELVKRLKATDIMYNETLLQIGQSHLKHSPAGETTMKPKKLHTDCHTITRQLNQRKMQLVP